MKTFFKETNKQYSVKKYKNKSPWREVEKYNRREGEIFVVYTSDKCI